MSRDCVVRIEKLEPPYDDRYEQKTESASACNAADSKASACDRMELLQKQSKTDAWNAVCQDVTQSANDLKVTDKDACGTDDVNSPTSDDGYLVMVDDSDDSASNYEVNLDLPSQCSHDNASSRDNSSNYEVDIDLPSHSSDRSEDTAEKTHDFEDAPGMCLSCVGTSALETIQTNYQYQPVVSLKKLDLAELKRWTADSKSESRVQDEGCIGNSKYVICLFATNIVYLLHIFAILWSYYI